MRNLNLKSALLGLATMASASFAMAQVTTSWSNGASILVPGTGTGGIANPYPSGIVVSGMPNGVTNVAVTLKKVNHTWSSDIDVVLVAPNGQAVVLMSDVGSSGDPVNFNYTFIDGFPAMSASTLNPAGTYRPTNDGATDAFASPGPGSLTQATPSLGSLNGINPNGTWNLYVVDDASGDAGNISAGWDLVISSGASCGAPNTLAASGVTTTSATITWNAAVSGFFAVEYGPAGYTPGTGTLVTTPLTTTTLTGLTQGTAYDVYIAQVCGTGSSTLAGPLAFSTLLANDNPCGAIALGVGTSCNTTAGTTVGATASGVTGPSCGGGNTNADDDVWYSFVAPASGNIVVTGATGTATDLVASVYAAASCSGPFTEVGCNDDGGAGLLPGLSLTGLTPGATYYLRWNTFGTTVRGTYGVCVYDPQPCGGAASISSAVACGTSATVTLSISSSAIEPAFQWQEEAPVGSNNWVNLGASTTSTTLSVTVPSPGARRYRALVSSFSCQAAASNSVDFLLDNPAAPTGSNVSRCGAGSVTLSASSPTGQVNWYAAATGGAALASGTSFTTSVSATTTFYAATFNPASGCESSVRTPITATVNPVPVVSASANAGETCDNSCVSLSATGSVSGTSTATFSNNTSVAILDVSTVNSSIAVSGVNPATLGAGSIANVTINLNHTWDADLDISLVAPDGSVIDLTSDNGSSGDNYTNTVFTTGAPAVTGGTAPFSGSFSPEQPFSNLTGSANGNWTLRIADDLGGDVGTLFSWSITFNTVVSNAVDYTWSGPGLSSNSGASVNACPSLGNSSAQTVTYTVTATDAITGCSSSANVDVVVNPLPSVSISKPAAPAENNGADITLCYGDQSVTLTAAGAGGTAGYTYLWSNGATGATNTVSPTTTTTYSVTVTDSKGCTASSSITVCVVDACCGNGKVNVCHVPPGNPGNQHNICISSNAVPAHIAQHGDYLGACGSNGCGSAKSGNSVAAEALSGSEHGAFPNPFSNASTIYFRVANTVHATVEVFNANGALVQVLYKGEVEAGQETKVQFNGADMPAGIYLYRIQAGAEVMDGKLMLTK